MLYRIKDITQFDNENVTETLIDEYEFSPQSNRITLRCHRNKNEIIRSIKCMSTETGVFSIRIGGLRVHSTELKFNEELLPNIIPSYLLTEHDVVIEVDDISHVISLSITYYRVDNLISQLSIKDFIVIDNFHCPWSPDDKGILVIKNGMGALAVEKMIDELYKQHMNPTSVDIFQKEGFLPLSVSIGINNIGTYSLPISFDDPYCNRKEFPINLIDGKYKISIISKEDSDNIFMKNSPFSTEYNFVLTISNGNVSIQTENTNYNNDCLYICFVSVDKGNLYIHNLPKYPGSKHITMNYYVTFKPMFKKLE